MKNPSRALLGLLLLGGLVSATAAGVAVGWSQRRVMAAVERSRHNPTAVAEIVAANGRLGALPAFRSLGRARDAGELLNRHLALDDGTPAAEAVWWTDGELRDRIKEVWLKDPGSLSAEGAGPALDDSVLRPLQAYDHWDPTSSGAYAAHLSAAPSGPLAEAPIPVWTGLQLLARARLARGLHEQDLLPALREVRHLARLCLGLEDLVGAMMGILILRFEGQAARQAEAEGLLEPGAWVAVSDSDLDLAKATIWSSIDLFDLTPQHTAGAYMAQEEAVARCAVLAEAGFRLRLLTSQVDRPRWPLEADLFTGVEQFERDWAASGCRLASLRRYWGDDGAPAVDPEDETAFAGLPYVRTGVTSILVSSIATADAGVDHPLEGQAAGR